MEKSRLHKKPWSITTTLRNPERLRMFLFVLKQLNGLRWNSESQKKYQILLIKKRVYGYGRPQFYQGLSSRLIDLIDDPNQDISFEKAKEIFETKHYKDPAMRGRQSINPLKKMGFVIIKENKICITDLGQLFLKDDFDLGEIFFRSFTKWQIPNPDSTDYKLADGYNIKPFIAVMHLIRLVNEKSLKIGEKANGISKSEFSFFCPILVHFEDIEKYAQSIMTLRKKQNGKKLQEQKKIFNNHCQEFIANFFCVNDKKKIETLIQNLKDYGDNAIRYFRLTRFIYIRGNGFYIDLEPRRHIEIKNLLAFDNAQSINFTSREEYLEYIADINKPKFPWESKEKLNEIISYLIKDVRDFEKDLNIASRNILEYHIFNEKNLKEYVLKLRYYRRYLQDKKNYKKLQEVGEINNCIEKLKHIFDFDNSSILLEKLSYLGLNALNDALKIKANYPVGDDNEPTFTAPANTPDIECYYKDFNVICEVTMLTSRNQWYSEGQPVMRHLRDFENQNQTLNYCLFIPQNPQRHYQYLLDSY